MAKKHEILTAALAAMLLAEPLFAQEPPVTGSGVNRGPVPGGFGADSNTTRSGVVPSPTSFPPGALPPGGYELGPGIPPAGFPAPGSGAPGQLQPPPSPFALPGQMTAVPPPRMREVSWIFIESAPPKKVRVHDILTVMIDEKSEVVQTSRFDRQRNILLRAQLREFLRIGTSGNLRPAALDQPQVDAQLRSQMNSYGNAKTNEGMKYRIAATVVDVLPNGTLVLEARKTIRTNTEVWEYSLTGRCRTEDIQANNTIVSENIADMNISKVERGKVRDSADRGWFTWLYDILLPF